MPDPTRRDVLGAVAATALNSGLTPAARRDLTRAENDRDGTTDWQLTYVKFDGGAKHRQSLIEGYCTRDSVPAGGRIGFCVSTAPASPFTIDLYRLGYYRGAGGRLMTTLGPFPGKPQPVPPVGPQRLRECRWEPCTEFAVPKDWPSGVYLGKLSAAAHRYQSYLTFVVTDGRPADVLFQCSTHTWQAYNLWPDGYSLYHNDRPDKKPLVSGVRASFDRPYARYPQVSDNPLSLGSGEFLLWEFPFAYWLEEHGYDVTYCTNGDVHRSADLPARCKAFLSVGHDEYWTRRQYDHVAAAIKNGVNAGFFGGNSVCWVTGAYPAADGRADRVLERRGRFGGLRPVEEPWAADLPDDGPDEALLMGARTVIPFNGSGDWVCARPEHWLFAGTGMKKGDRIPGLVGWEHHGDPAAIPGLEVVAAGKTWNGGGEESHYEATVYPGPKGNTVFNAATIFWAQGLSSPPGHWLPFVHNGRPHGPDRRVQRMTKNLLDRWVGG